jgi:Protein of unknown function (DUF3987)
MALLAAASGLIGRTRGVVVKEGYVEYPCLYSALVGEAGTAQTPALNAVTAPVRAIDDRLERENQAAMAAYRAEKAAYEAGRRAGEPPSRPRWRRVTADDFTGECLPGILAADPRGGLLVFDSGRARDVLDGRQPRRMTAKEREEHRRQRYEYFEHFAAGEGWFAADAYGRFHSPLTALEAELRCCLRVAARDRATGEGRLLPLVGIDLKNSQPLFLGLIARRYFGGSAGARSRLINRTFGAGNPYHAASHSLSRNPTPAPLHSPD